MGKFSPCQNDPNTTWGLSAVSSTALGHSNAVTNDVFINDVLINYVFKTTQGKYIWPINYKYINILAKKYIYRYWKGYIWLCSCTHADKELYLVREAVRRWRQPDKSLMCDSDLFQTALSHQWVEFHLQNWWHMNKKNYKCGLKRVFIISSNVFQNVIAACRIQFKSWII